MGSDFHLIVVCAYYTNYPLPLNEIHKASKVWFLFSIIVLFWSPPAQGRICNSISSVDLNIKSNRKYLKSLVVATVLTSAWGPALDVDCINFTVLWIKDQCDQLRTELSQEIQSLSLTRLVQLFRFFNISLNTLSSVFTLLLQLLHISRGG